MQNIREIVDDMTKRGACRAVATRADIDAVLESIDRRDPQLGECGKQAREVWEANAGACARIVAEIVRLAAHAPADRKMARENIMESGL